MSQWARRRWVQPGPFKLAHSTVDCPPLVFIAAASPKHQMLESSSSAHVASSAVLTATKLRPLSAAHAGSVGSVSSVRGVSPWPLPGDSPQHSRAELLRVRPQVWLYPAEMEAKACSPATATGSLSNPSSFSPGLLPLPSSPKTELCTHLKGVQDR